MAKTFRGSSSPGRYGLLDPNLAFGETKRLVDDNKRDKADRDKNRAALADRNRARQNSLIASFGPADQSRQLALSDEKARRGQSTEMHMKRIEQARITADRNATNQANQSIKARQELVTLIKDVGGTAIDAYETYNNIKDTEDRKELFKIGAKYNANTETLVGIRSLNLDLIGEGQADHEKHQALIAAGWSPLDIIKVKESREAAFYTAKVNALQRDVKNIPNLLATDPDYQKASDELAYQGDEAGWSVLYDDKIASLSVIGAGLNPHAQSTNQFYTQLQNAKAAALSKFRAQANIHAQAQLDADSVGFTKAGMNQYLHNAPAWASWVSQQASDKANPVGFINEQFGNIETLAKGADAGELTRLRSYYDSLANTIPKNGKLTYDQDPRFSKAALAARKAIYDTGNQDLKDTVLAQKTTAQEVHDHIQQIINDPNLSPEEKITELEATKIAAAGMPLGTQAAGISGAIDRYLELHTPENANEAMFYRDLKMPGYVTQDMIDRGEYGSDAKSQYKLSKVLAESERNDKVWQKMLNKVESDLKKAVGVNLTTSILPGSYYEALDDATEQLQKTRQDTLYRTNGDQKAADQDMNDWWVKEGPNKENYFEGRYAIWDRAKHAHKDGFSNPLFHGLQGEPSGKTIKTYTDIKDVFTKNNLDTYDSRYTEVTSNSNISKQLITDEQLKAWTANPHLNVGISNLLKNIDRQTGSRGIPKLAEDIAKSRNMDIPQTPQQALHERAAEIRLKFGGVNADRFNNNTLMRRGEGGSIRYDYIREDAQTAGYNLAPTGSDYTHALFPGKVIQIRHQFNQNAIGGDGRPGAGWGHHVIIRHTNPRTGEEYDMVYAHFPKDSIQVRAGQTVTQGQILGPMATDDQFTNDRPNVGSGRGVHMSVDMFEKNSNTPYRNWRQVGELIRGLGRETSQPQQQQVKTEPLVVPMPELELEPEPETAAFNKIHDLPGLPDVKVIESSIGEHGFNVRGPNGWKQYRAEEGNLSRLKEKYPEAYAAYNEIVNRGGNA